MITKQESLNYMKFEQRNFFWKNNLFTSKQLNYLQKKLIIKKYFSKRSFIHFLSLKYRFGIFSASLEPPW